MHQTDYLSTARNSIDLTNNDIQMAKYKILKLNNIQSNIYSAIQLHYTNNRNIKT